MRQAGGAPPAPKPGSPRWRVDLEGVAQRAKQMRETTDEDTLVGPNGGQSLKQLRAEHAQFKQALEMIADGASTQIALDALGKRRPYDELVEENRQMAQLMELYEGTLQAIREGKLRAEDLPDLAGDENVTASHSDGGEHPAENG